MSTDLSELGIYTLRMLRVMPVSLSSIWIPHRLSQHAKLRGEAFRLFFQMIATQPQPRVSSEEELRRLSAIAVKLKSG